MDEINGYCEVEFINGENREVNVKRNIVDGYGHFLHLEAVDGRLYNWTNIVSIRKM